MYVQEVLQTLNRFWSERGCLLWQPYHTEVGAGTSNPATFLRVLGPEPWSVAYPEPSTRPTDGRYGENPNRLQHYYQYQVILKPSPPDVQELFLQSLEALGLDLHKHDFRFVEDNWQSPSLGAWGLGWEAWLDGMEVLQFTYFQECGGVKLDVRACELTYGIERICMYLQGVENVYDLVWAPSGVTYRDIFHASEVEYCHYNFQAADTDKLFNVFDIWESEGARLLELGFILPAYDHCLRLSHLFNVLDARGALSVTERGRFLLRCRAIAERCAKGFLAQREAMGFPMLRHAKPIAELTAPAKAPESSEYSPEETLLVEIGVEELPDKDIQTLEAQAPALFSKLMAERGLSHGPLTVYVSPRRIAIQAPNVPSRQKDVSKEVRGPKRAVCKDDNGNWTMPAKRFAEGNGVSVEDIYFREDGKAEYAFAQVQQKGRHLSKLLNEIVNDFVTGIHFVKTMGWENSTLVFSRPIRWVVALHGSTLVPVQIKLRDASEIGPERFVYSGRESYGHRRLAAGPVTISSAQSYVDDLRGRLVLVDGAERKAVLRDKVLALATEMNLVPEQDEDLYTEIANLAEWPEPIVGAIPEDALTLPEEVIITPMKVHQRYIPLRTANGKLSHYFVCVANGEHSAEGKAIIRQGNERVLNARLRDAKYFWDSDTQTPLKAFAEKLSSVMFHQKLGTVADKVARLRDLYFTLKGHLPLVDDRKMADVLTLMKADLTTQMVFEFDSLEGVVGMLYAKKEGIAHDIADAIAEHRLPRRAGDQLPSSALGIVAALLDRFDTLAGYFGIGMRVKGTSDPFGLRRNALALLSIVESAGLEIDLETFFRAALANYGTVVHAPDKALQELIDFFNDRMAVVLRDQGFSYDLVAAALATHGRRPRHARECAKALGRLEDSEVQSLAEQTKRMQRIIKEPADSLDAGLLTEPEQNLLAECNAIRDRIPALMERHEFDDAIEAISHAVPVISGFFEKVLVNDPDERVRRNRQALLQQFLNTVTQVADFTRIEKK
ncbi:MAG: glycine--tRNA ligase subunit beta [Candidatus Hydrogenedentes bacterium]|nr:glycine--tRNA ligase subunit beta [Candidatus Hydrogenedentota bacterium]